MKKQTKWIVILIASIAVLAVVIVGMAYTANARARENLLLGEPAETIFHLGGPGFPGGAPGKDQYLADALGISVAQLQTAEQKASDAAIQQAVKEGVITQEQADAMTLHGFPFGGRFGLHGLSGPDGRIDYDALLADALGISVDRLQAAREKALDARLAEAVVNGDLTQEQADLLKAHKALQSYLEPQALFAEALGISADQLQTYREEGLSLSEILAKVGKTAAEVRDAQQAAYQAALDKAVADGVISQAQADQLQAGWFRGLGGFGRDFGREGFQKDFHGGDLGRFGGFDGWKAAPQNPAQQTPAPTGGSDG